LPSLRAVEGTVDGVERAVLADVIEVPVRRTWATALHSAEADGPNGDHPFGPKITLSDGRRSFLLMRMGRRRSRFLVVEFLEFQMRILSLGAG
jgi:hypothetical protein